MNNFKRSLFAIFIALFVSISCEKEEEPSVKNGKIAFSFAPQPPSQGGRTSSTNEPKYINLWVQKVGTTGYDGARYFQVEILKFGNEYVTVPIELPVGSYDLVNFSVYDANGRALYAVPGVDSKFGHLVKYPLPIRMDAVYDQTVTLTLEVVTIDIYTNPQDLGYASFSFDIIEPISFQLAVFIYNEASQHFELATSSLRVMSNRDTLFQSELPASTNKVVIKNTHTDFDLLISRPGYAPFGITLTEAELKRYEPLSAELRSEVLIVRLVDPASPQVPNQALKLDGIDDYIDFGDIYDNVKFPITASAWINLNPSANYSAFAPIFVSQDNDPLYNGFWLVATKDKLFMEYGDGRGELNADFKRGKATIGDNDKSDKWIHVCSVIRGPQDIDLYYNAMNAGGELTGNSTLPMSSLHPNDVARSGRWTHNGSTLFFNGSIDDLTVWNKALTQQEVAFYKEHKATPHAPGLIGYWDFDEASGNVAIDKSLNKLNGVIKGGATRIPSGALVN